MALRPPRRRTKLSDVIVEDVKRLIVAERLKPGDRVPSEPDLIETYGCSKGTVREALKALEVEGLVVTRTGPGGGAYLADAGSEPAARMLRNFLHFQHLDGEGVPDSQGGGAGTRRLGGRAAERGAVRRVGGQRRCL